MTPPLWPTLKESVEYHATSGQRAANTDLVVKLCRARTLSDPEVIDLVAGASMANDSRASAPRPEYADQGAVESAAAGGARLPLNREHRGAGGV
jgi:hypothetical protein